MSRRRLALLLCLSVCLSPALLPAAATADDPDQQTLRVEETATRVTLDGGFIRVSLAVVNPTARDLPARVRLDLLDTEDKVVAGAAPDATLRPGASRVETLLNVSGLRLSGEWRRHFLWYRLRYSVEPTPAAAQTLNAAALQNLRAEGVVSLSEVTRDLFELRVASPGRVRPGQTFRVRVRAVHPLTDRPVRGVRLDGRVEFDDDKDEEVELKSAATTDSDGLAALDFPVPANADDDELEIEVEGRLGDVVQSASDDVEFDRSLRVLLTTDKPLYQPGQTLHARALVVTKTDRAVSGATAKLEIEDPEGTTVFKAELKTSRFGVASADWPVPEGTRLGDYSVEFELDDGRYDSDDGGEARAQVKVSRYELPNFAVSTKPDRDYYLRGEQASVEVRADYLFGQPVKRGRVRVVRERERQWNYREQKYEVEEGEKYEGELDGAGRFVAPVDLSKEHLKLAESSWARFADLSYAAYVTDASTNRTEQRRFSLRLTRDPLHVYVSSANTRQARGLPLEFYVTTAYADGTPAECEVTVAEPPTGTPGGGSLAAAAGGRARGAVLRTLKTNRFGVAKLKGPSLPRAAEAGRSLSLLFTARDRRGREGRHVEEFWPSDRPVVRVETDKSIYGAGEPVAAEITSDKPDLRVFVEAVSGGRSLSAQTVRLSGGRASVTFPYRKEFQNRVTVAAYTADIPESSYDADFVKGARTVIYPRDREMKLDVDFARATYRPGEEAEATVRAQSATGRNGETALGVVVFDKAVEERARTEQEFSSSYGFSDSFVSFWYGGDAVAGWTLRDLEKLDASKTRPAGLELVAELLLRREDEHEPNFFGGGDYDTNQQGAFAALAKRQLAAARAALSARFERTGEHPSDESSLRRLLAAEGVEPSSLRDPWGAPYRAVFSIERAFDLLDFESAGADERFGTGDDWRTGRLQWPYFQQTGRRINRAVADYRQRTGEYLRDAAAVKAELRRAGIDFDDLRDRWGRPYDLRFNVSGAHYAVNVVSAGPDGRLSLENTYSADDFTVWTTWVDYFSETRTRIDAALSAYLKETGAFPKDEKTLADVLRRTGLRLETLRDFWGRPYYATFRADATYADRVQTSGTAAAGTRTEVTPVTRRLDYVTVRSAGPDGLPGTYDDLNVAEFSTTKSEQSARDAAPKPVTSPVANVAGTGAVSGVVTDPNGAGVPDATVTATHQQMTDYAREVKTDESGAYLIRNLPAGLYTLKVEANYFTPFVTMGVPVQSASLTTVDAALSVGMITETVNVTGGVSLLQTSASYMITTKSQGVSTSSPKTARPPITTPRLRKDFPETLYWQPELVTDKRGRSEIKFKLADNITTWKVSVIGSNEAGEIGTVEKELRAFQPFFVELDPPQVLTEGDQISLPAVVRNYHDRPQQVALDIKPESWFTLAGPAAKQTTVPAGDSSRETFELRAVESIADGKQRVTARGGDDADAIEKSVRVHPDGEEVADTATRLVSGSGAIDLAVPANVIPRSLRAELKVYPSPLAHVFESVEAIMARPYGCAEQTISSSYPSLLVLRYYTALYGEDAAKHPPVARKAAEYLRQGYDRLLSYRSSDGGFSYWGRGDSDTALTAHALRFLEDARALVEIDEHVINGARDFLARRQRPDGSWPAYAGDDTGARARGAMLTAYVARVLASGARRDADKARPANTPPANAPQPPGATAIKPAPPTPLARALDYLARRSEEFDEPYLIAAYALALADTGADPARLGRVAARLNSLARHEGDASYWSLETNTPFYGWGRAGRIETTALAVQALARAEVKGDERGRGLLFLLKNKDAHGVWHSTQATVNVLDALMLIAPVRAAAPAGAQPTQTAEVFVNGRPAGTLSLPPATEPAALVTLDLTRLFAAGSNRVEIRRAEGAPVVTAQVVAGYYVPWSEARADGPGRGPDSSRSLRLAVSFDRTEAAAGDEVTCRVEAERVGHRGYGMLLAEVGLPPGADVDRASLERAMKESGWELSRYDVLPDRLVVYLWPRAGGTRFRFAFRPRFGLRARSAPSQVYDYYNPDARALVAPTDFVFTEPAKSATAAGAGGPSPGGAARH